MKETAVRRCEEQCTGQKEQPVQRPAEGKSSGPGTGMRPASLGLEQVGGTKGLLYWASGARMEAWARGRGVAMLRSGEVSPALQDSVTCYYPWGVGGDGTSSRTTASFYAPRNVWPIKEGGLVPGK